MAIRTSISSSAGVHSLGRGTTPEIIVGLLGAADEAWDDGVECCLRYAHAMGGVTFMFDVVSFFGRRRVRLRCVEYECEKPGLVPRTEA